MRTAFSNRSLFPLSVLLASACLGATAAFTPIGPSTVSPGTPVQFNVTVSTQTLAGFDAADIVIGSHQAHNLSFVYSAAWQSAFAAVTPPTPDLLPGYYAQDVFVGGNRAPTILQSLALGVVTVDTTGLLEGDHQVRIDADVVTNQISTIALSGSVEDVVGLGVFAVVCPPVDPQCDNDVDLGDFQLLAPCVTGPDVPAGVQCQRYDMDADADVDFGDVSEFLAQFTGAR